MSLSEVQVNDLARPLVGIISKFYADPKNEEDFQKWLRNVEERKQKESTDTNIFGTRLLLTLGVEILGKELDPTIFKPFENIDELIRFKQN